MVRNHHRRHQGRFTRLRSLVRSLTAPAALGLLLTFAVPARPPAQAQTPLAPANQAALDDLLVGKRLLIDVENVDYVDFISPSRYFVYPDDAPGSYIYRKTDPNTGIVTVTLTRDSSSRHVSICLIFDSRTTGRYFNCHDLENAAGKLVDIPADAHWTITTVAGGPAIGDGGPAVEAHLRAPRGVAVDGAGNLYIADSPNHRILKVDSTGTITTIAGTGVPGFSGDGGPAVEAHLRAPRGVAVDGAGNLYIADSPNHRILKVDSTGTITTIAGTGVPGFSGDGGPAVEAHLAYPGGVAVDGAGNLYIADTANRRIRKVDSTGTITTITGTGADDYSIIEDGGPAVEAFLAVPEGVAVDGAGNLYIVDTWSQRILKVDSTGTITTIAGRDDLGTGNPGFSGDGGPAVEAHFAYPRGVAVDGAGNLYIADTDNQRIRKVDSTGTITTIAGTVVRNIARGFSGDGGPATAAQLYAPEGVAVDGAGNLYIADTHNRRIRKVDSTGTITTIAGAVVRGFSGDGGPATAAQLSAPEGVAVDGAGNLYIADTHNDRIRKVDSTGTITTIAGTADYGLSGDGGPAVEAHLYFPLDVAVDEAGNVYIADHSNNRIRKVDSTGTITTIAGTGRTRQGVGEAGLSGDGGPAVEAHLRSPYDVAVDEAGNVYIADHWNSRIRKVDSTGTITTIAGTGRTRQGVGKDGFSGDGGPAVEAHLNYPEGVAVDGAGNVYIADTGNHRIRKVDSTGTITTIAGTGRRGFRGDGGQAVEAHLSNPKDVAVDGAGNLYIADSIHNRIRKVDSTGTITTIARAGSFGFSGDGWPAIGAQSSGASVAVDGAGNVYIADSGNHRIRVLTLGMDGAGDEKETEPLDDPSAFTGEDLEGEQLTLRLTGDEETTRNIELRFGEGNRFEHLGSIQPAAATRSAGAASRSQSTTSRSGTYAYRRTGPGMGTITLTYDDGPTCEIRLSFTESGVGGFAYDCGDGNPAEGSFQLTTGSLFVPVILSSAGRNQSFFTSELTLTNRGDEEVKLDYTYTAHIGGGSGKAQEVLAPGRQKIQTNAITYLRRLGVPIPDSGNRIGTLRVAVDLGSEVEAVVRTTTMVPDGRAGLAYLGIAEEEGFDEPAYLCGLRQNSQDRSNVAFQNMGTPEEGSITLRTTVYSGEAADASPRVLREVELDPGGFHQFSPVLGTVANGYVKVERVKGQAPFYAYGVINDQINSDGSFVFPVTASSLEGKTGQTLPVIVETSEFRSELTVTNFSEDPRTLDFEFVSDQIRASGKTASFSMTLEAGEQMIVPEVVEELRRQGVAGLGTTRGFYAGPLFVKSEDGDLSGIVIGARTGSKGGGGSYSVFYNAVPFGEAFSREAWVEGLQQNEENRSNLALVNTGEVDGSESVFHLEIYDGETGMLVETVVTKPIPARRWHQINGILGRYAPQSRQGYIRILKVSGQNPFLAYGVVNDGGAPGERSGDGAYLPARE